MPLITFFGMQIGEISRREFITLGLGLLVVTSKAKAFAPRKTALPKVLIIGAGMAGLSASRRLQDSGRCEVLILEARDRIGGRVFTRHDSLGNIREEGAAWIHGEEGNPLIELCARYGIETIPADNWSDIVTFDSAGPVSPEQRKRYEDLYRDLIADLHIEKRSFKEDLEKDISLRAALDRQLGRIDPADRDFLEHLFKVNIEDDYGANLEQISFINWNGEKDPAYPDRIIPQGYGVLAEKVGADINIRFDTEICAVDYSGPRVKVVDVRGRTFEADQVLVTLPLGVLKKGVIRFSPELPSWKKQAISKVGFGSFSKVFLNFKRCFWPEKASWIEAARGQIPHLSSFFNLQKFGGACGLVGLASGKSSDCVQSLSGAALQTWADESIQVISREAGEASEIECTRWSGDRFSAGAYSFPALGESVAERDLIGKSVGPQLHFAGEACQADFYGTVHAAWISGQRAAEQILGSL